MKKTIITAIKLTLAVALLSACITACTTAKVTPATPTTPATTNYIVDPRLTTTLTTIGDVNKATAPVNPFAPLIDIGLGAAALIASWVAKRKNDQAAQSSLLLKTVIQAVDAIDQQPIKDAIQAHAVRVGSEVQLNQVVKKVSSGLV